MARDYTKNYKSSSFGPVKKRDKKRLAVRAFFAVAALAAILGAGYFFIFSDFFKINNISIRGNDYIASSAIIEGFENIMSRERLAILKNDNMNMINLGDAKLDLIEMFPRIEELSISKKYPQSIEISIKEKQITEILCQENNSKCYFIDKNGIAFDEAAQTQGFLIIKIIDKRGQQIEPGHKALDREFIDFIGVIKKNHKNYLEHNIKWFVLDHPAQREVVAIVDDWEIIFDTTGDPQKQLFILKEVLQKEIKDQKSNLEYVDLRVDGRAYYKLAD